MPVITTSRLKKLLCQTLIREKLSYKIIFQNTTFLFSPLKLKNNFMNKSNLRNPFPFLKLIKLPTYTSNSTLVIRKESSDSSHECIILDVIHHVLIKNMYMCSLKTFVRFYWLLWTMRLVLNAS